MYFITANERERKHEIAQKHKTLRDLKQKRAKCVESSIRFPDDGKPSRMRPWKWHIQQWDKMIYNCRRDLARLIARVNRFTPEWRSA